MRRSLFFRFDEPTAVTNQLPNVIRCTHTCTLRHMRMILVGATFGPQMSQKLGGRMQMFPLLIQEYWCADPDQEVDLQTFI